MKKLVESFSMILVLLSFPLLIGALMIEYILPGREMEELSGIAMDLKDSAESNKNVDRFLSMYIELFILLWKQLLIIIGFIALWIKLCPYD